MNYIKDIELLHDDKTVNMIVEIEKGTNKKFELDENDFSKVELIRKVKGKYPFYYGCFPQTLADDGDALDAILITNTKHEKLDVVNCQLIGVIKTIDEGKEDHKLLLIQDDEQISNIDKIEKKILKFLKSYKGKHADMIIDETIYDAIEALKILRKDHSLYINKLNSEKELKILVS